MVFIIMCQRDLTLIANAFYVINEENDNLFFHQANDRRDFSINEGEKAMPKVPKRLNLLKYCERNLPLSTVLLTKTRSVSLAEP
ncbi:hypothetical protein [Alteromonas sp. W364]|jgi:hypothetical protein|uniref:hypothetical protein n=1 Tax=Alteromonas sp. W364 TaxID=3075610 RepID=UPI0028841FF7|nr:hypothetical protein [Alteromonas sp. W364]MDT0629724.1 hypothetical protein [Alteromonas sp. W364]